MDEPRKTEAPTFDEALEKTGNGLYNVLLTVTCSLVLLAIIADLFGFSLVVGAACDLDLTVSQKGILTSVPFIGIIFISYFWGYISDTRGRKFTLVVSVQMGFILSCLSSVSPNWIFLGFVKFFSVCFSCAANSATYTLVGESCVQRVRSKYMLLMTCLVLLGPAVAGALAYPVLNQLNIALEISWLGIVFRPWRLLIIVLALPSGLGAIAIRFFHESPKFLFNSGKQDQALEVLKSIYAVNHRCSKEDFKVDSLSTDDQVSRKPMSILRGMYEQSAPLFRPPYLWRTFQLFYIVAIVYITNNSFLVWLPHIMNLVKISLESNGTVPGSICSLISTENMMRTDSSSNITTGVNPEMCLGTVKDSVILTLLASQCIFSFLNLVISYLPTHRKKVLISVLCLSSASAILVNLMPDPVSSVIFFVLFTCTCLCMGILASYFVDLYPTSYRGMVACLSIMVGRTSTFVGINVVGNLFFHHCHVTFYAWSLLVLSSVVAAWFLPPDKTKETATKL